jgi:hypothetical protein
VAHNADSFTSLAGLDRYSYAPPLHVTRIRYERNEPAAQLVQPRHGLWTRRRASHFAAEDVARHERNHRPIGRRGSYAIFLSEIRSRCGPADNLERYERRGRHYHKADPTCREGGSGRTAGKWKDMAGTTDDRVIHLITAPSSLTRNDTFDTIHRHKGSCCTSRENDTL